MSVSFLSKFERGESEISLSRFLLLLENIDVSIEEFYSLLSKENATKTEQLLGKVSKAYYQNNLIALKKYYNEEMDAYNNSHKKSYLYNSIMIESFMVSITGEKIEQYKIDQISDYLFDIEQWGKRELIILGNSMSAIPSKTLDILTKEIIYKTTLFGHEEENKRMRISLMINSISKFIDRNLLDLAKKYLDLLFEMKIPETFLYERFEYNMVLGSYWIKIGKIEIGKKKDRISLRCIKKPRSTEYLTFSRKLLSKSLEFHYMTISNSHSYYLVHFSYK